jgi:hypothetical protein
MLGWNHWVEQRKTRMMKERDYTIERERGKEKVYIIKQKHSSPATDKCIPWFIIKVAAMHWTIKQSKLLGPIQGYLTIMKLSLQCFIHLEAIQFRKEREKRENI